MSSHKSELCGNCRHDTQQRAYPSDAAHISATLFSAKHSIDGKRTPIHLYKSSTLCFEQSVWNSCICAGVVCRKQLRRRQRSTKLTQFGAKTAHRKGFPNTQASLVRGQRDASVAGCQHTRTRALFFSFFNTAVNFVCQRTHRKRYAQTIFKIQGRSEKKKMIQKRRKKINT